jgi:regulator of protease activity HflC (stomatin/prohibitin superfamily)
MKVNDSKLGKRDIGTAVMVGIVGLMSLDMFGLTADVAIEIVVGLVILILIAVVILLTSSMRIVQPYQQGLLIVLGSFRRVLNPGVNFVPPMISEVRRIDLRTQVLDVPRQEVITKDNSPTNVDAIIYIKVIDPKKSFFEVTDYHIATLALAQTTLRSIIGDMELDEVLYNRDRINLRLRDVLDEATDKWGVKVDAVEIREVDPVGPVKAAMEEQTSAERQRRAAILRADGEKRSAILVAEGQKRSRILQAEGLRQAKILESDGQRLSIILEGQGEAQKLRILALGAAALDTKALSVLSMDTVKDMARGQATKIIFPFEISKMIEGISSYLGAATAKVPEREIADIATLEKALGKMDQILGPLPNPEEIREEMRYIKEEMRGISPSTGASMPEDVKKRKTVEEILKEEEDEAMRGK